MEKKQKNLEHLREK